MTREELRNILDSLISIRGSDGWGQLQKHTWKRGAALKETALEKGGDRYDSGYASGYDECRKELHYFIQELEQQLNRDSED